MKKVLSLTFSLVLILSLGLSHAGEAPWSSTPVSIQVQEQPLAQFLKDFFSAQGMTVIVNDSVSGRVSGQFSDTPKQIFEHMVKAYGLLPYYDGRVTHISTTSDIQSKSYTLKTTQMSKTINALIVQDIADQYQSIKVLKSQGVIKARGAPEFILDIEELINATKPKPRRVIPAPVIVTEKKRNELIFKTFRLEYASAADVVLFQGGREFTIPGVASMLQSMVGDGRSPAATSLYFSQPQDQSIPGLRGQGLRQHAISQEEKTQPLPVTVTPGGVATNRTFVARIEAERNLNAVIVRDYADSMPLYAQLINELDKEPLLVEIQVTIIDVDKSKLLDLGVDWRYQDSRNDATFGGGDVVDQNGGLLLNTVLGETGRFLARVNALATTGSADVVSRPQVITLSNLEAVLSSDQEFFVRIAGQEEVDLFNVSVGTSLRVVPNVVGNPSDPQIRLLVAIEDGSIVPDAAVDDIPVVEKASLSTQAMIYNGESLLLGGLVRESTSTNVRKVPFLGDVPGVGRLFKRKTDVSTTAERLFLITPRVVNNQRVGRAKQSSQRTFDVQSADPKAYLDGF